MPGPGTCDGQGAPAHAHKRAAAPACGRGSYHSPNQMPYPILPQPKPDAAQQRQLGLARLQHRRQAQVLQRAAAEQAAGVQLRVLRAARRASAAAGA